MGFITGVCTLFVALYIIALVETKKSNDQFKELYINGKEIGENYKF